MGLSKNFCYIKSGTEVNIYLEKSKDITSVKKLINKTAIIKVLEYINNNNYNNYVII